MPGLKSELSYVFVCELLSHVQLFVTPWTVVFQASYTIASLKWQEKGLPAEGDFLQGAAHIKVPGAWRGPHPDVLHSELGQRSGPSPADSPPAPLFPVPSPFCPFLQHLSKVPFPILSFSWRASLAAELLQDRSSARSRSVPWWQRKQKTHWKISTGLQTPGTRKVSRGHFMHPSYLIRGGAKARGQVHGCLRSPWCD